MLGWHQDGTCRFRLCASFHASSACPRLDETSSARGERGPGASVGARLRRLTLSCARVQKESAKEKAANKAAAAAEAAGV